MNIQEKLYPYQRAEREWLKSHPEARAIITIHPYREVGWKGWVIVLEDPTTKELWQRRFYYKKDAERLKEELEGRLLESILGIYGTLYFEQVR